jgi:hypothetical protein
MIYHPGAIYFWGVMHRTNLSKHIIRGHKITALAAILDFQGKHFTRYRARSRVNFIT